MATWLPLPGSIPQMCARYVDDSLGFAVGWNQWYQSSLTLCSEISAAASLIGYWNDTINPAPWIIIVIIIIVCLNIFAVSIYGEAEFVFASIKIITILGLLIFAFIVDLGGSPTHDRIGFRYWKHPGAMAAAVPATGDTGRFLGFFSTLVNAAFSYGGVEMIAVAGGEAENPRKNIPKAVKRVFWRILFFYALGSLAIGVLVPYTNDKLLGSGARASPWVIAIEVAHIKALPSIINAVILTSATSSANAFLYAGSRYMFALAQNKQAPKFLLTCSKSGVPYYCVAITASIACLTFLSCGSSASNVFGWFLNLVTIANLITWCCICVASIRFQKALKAQGVSRNDLPFKSWAAPWGAYVSLIFFAIILVFNGWQVFCKGQWAVEPFITAYVGLPIFFGAYTFWKVYKRTPFIASADADIWTGKAAIDSEVWPEDNPTTWYGKVWAWIA